MSINVKGENGVIKFSGSSFDDTSHKYILISCAALHDQIIKKAYREIILDFSDIRKITTSFIVPLLPIINDYRSNKGVEFKLYLPHEESLERLFRNANWAHWINPNEFPQSDSMSHVKHMPAFRFENIDEHYEIVNQALDILVNTIEGIKRSDITAIEWSFNEITDNVLAHSQSKVGGYASVSCLPSYYDGKKVEIIVADAGIGIPKTLNKSPKQALTAAISQGVTSNPKTNQGNGLYGSHQLAVKSESDFEILSHTGHLLYHNQKLELDMKKTPYDGTMIRYVIDCAKPDLMKDFSFNGKKHEPDSVYLDNKLSDDVVIQLQSETYSRLRYSRSAAEKLRNEIQNKIKLLEPKKKIIIDFENVAVIPSSVADEIFAKLFWDIGMFKFQACIEMINMNELIENLIERAMTQRQPKEESTDN